MIIKFKKKKKKKKTFAKNTDSRLDIKVNPQCQSTTDKRPYLLFNEPYTAGTRGTEKYVYPDITKGSVTVNGSHKRIYNNGIVGHDMWQEISRFFHPKKGISNMNLTKFHTEDKFEGLNGVVAFTVNG